MHLPCHVTLVNGLFINTQGCTSRFHTENTQRTISSCGETSCWFLMKNAEVQREQWKEMSCDCPFIMSKIP